MESGLLFKVASEGVEPSHHQGYRGLSSVRLPITPRGHLAWFKKIIFTSWVNSIA